MISPLAAETYSEMYERIFGRPFKDEIHSTTVQVNIDNFKTGFCLAYISSRGKLVSLNSGDLLSIIKGYVIQEFYQELENRINKKNNTLDINALKAAGIEVLYKSTKLLVTLRTPPKQRREIIIELVGTPKKIDQIDTNVLLPADMSAYMNLRAYQEKYIESPFPEAPTSYLGLNGSVYHSGWFFKGDATYMSAYDYMLFFNQAFAEKQDPSTQQVWKMGAVPTYLTSHQKYFEVVGFSHSSGMLWRNNISVGQDQKFKVTINEPAKIEIFNGEDLIKSYELEPGKYVFTNFPKRFGHNEIIILINEKNKPEERHSFSLFYDNRLIFPKNGIYAITAGWPLNKSPGNWNFKHDPFTLTGFYKKNLSEDSAAGIYFQKAQNYSVLGWEYKKGLSFGLLENVFSVSTDENGKNGSAFNIEVSNYYKKQKRTFFMIPHWILGLDYQDRSFQQTLYPESVTDDTLTFSTLAGVELIPGIGMDVNTYYSFNNKYHDAYGCSTSLYYNWLFQTRISANWTSDLLQKKDWSVIFYATMMIPFVNSTMQYQRDFKRKVDTIDFDYRLNMLKLNQFDTNIDINQAGRYYGSARIRQGESHSEVAFGQDYLESRSRLHTSRGIAHFTYGEYGPSKSKRKKAAIQFDTAIAYADGQIGLSRPIHNSFAIFYAHPELKGRKIELKGKEAAIDAWGPAVIPDLSPFTVNTVMVKSDNLPIGLDLGRQIYRIYPYQESGFAIQIGSAAKVIALGKIIDDKDQPLSLIMGDLVYFSEGKIERKSFFLNRKGKFQLIGLVPGTYRVEIYGYQSVAFTIPEEAKGLYNIGVLVMKSILEKIEVIEEIKIIKPTPSKIKPIRKPKPKPKPKIKPPKPESKPTKKNENKLYLWLFDRIFKVSRLYGF